MELPVVYAYTDFRKYLVDWLAARQAMDKSFNRSEMHRRLGLPNTRSYLADVIAGKEITNTFLERFVTALQLSNEEARFFRVLVRFNQAQSSEERELAFDQLVALNRTPRTILDPRHWTYYKSWWHGAIRALLSIHNLGDEPHRIAQMLRPTLTDGQVRDSLKLLQELGLIARNPEGFWKPTQQILSTGDNVRDEMVRQLQSQQLRLVENAVLQTAKEEDQVVSTNTISVSEQGLALIRKRLEQFRSEVRSIVHKDEHAASRVHLITMSILPLTREVRNGGIALGETP